MEKSKKILTILSIIASFLLLISICLNVFFFFKIKNNLEYIDEGNNEEEISIFPQIIDLVDATSYDVSEYTDIVLDNYDGLIVTVNNYSEQNPEWFPYMVSYFQKAYYMESDLPLNERIDGLLTNMKIVNLDNAVNTFNRDNFIAGMQDIMNKNGTNLSSCELEVFDYGAGGISCTFVKEIDDVDYTGFDNTYAVLLLNKIDSVNDVLSSGFTLLVYGVRDEHTIVQLEAIGDIIEDLGVTDEEIISCLNDSGYSSDCMINLVSSDKYDQDINDVVNGLLEEYKLAL